jgi:hypothetical protein
VVLWGGRASVSRLYVEGSVQVEEEIAAGLTEVLARRLRDRVRDGVTKA